MRHPTAGSGFNPQVRFCADAIGTTAASETSNHPAELGRELRRPPPAEHLGERPVVPERPVALSAEPVKQRVSHHPQVCHDRACVVQLVRARDEQHRRRRLLEMRDVAFLSFTPGRLRNRLRVRAPLDDGEHGLTEVRPDPLAQCAHPAVIQGPAVLDRVVQQARDRLVAVPAVLEHQPRHSDQVRDVRDVGLLADLRRVQPGRKRQCALEVLVKRHSLGLVHFAAPCGSGHRARIN